MNNTLKTVAAVALAAALCLPAFAQEKIKPAKGGWGDFFKNLKNSLSQSAVSGERKKGRGGAVAAVRGKKQKDMADLNEPTLKGDSKSAKAKKDMSLDAELEAAVDLLSKGQLEDGLKALESFKAAHPKHRAEDVDKAIEGAKAMIAEKAGAPAAKE